MTMTATFSNGFTDTYKGDRDVKAAWAIFNKETGSVIKSGHSLDITKAAKTCEGNLQHVWFEGDLGISDHPLYYVKGPDYRDTAKIRRAKREHNAARLAFIRSMVTIEIIKI
jgi:hypothetical protein